MSNPVESLLENDHRSLDNVFQTLDQCLAELDATRAFELLDFAWARLAVHIRAEHLQLFPALLKRESSVDDTSQLITTLRNDHDFFMKELARLVQVMRENPSQEQLVDVRERLEVVRDRLVNHNRLEEEQAYLWPSEFLSEEELATLGEGINRELTNLPPRFRSHS